MNRLIPIACIALIGSASSTFAQQAEPGAPEKSADPKAAAPAAKVQSVVVQGTRADDIETRRLSTASKMVFGREELDRNGDTSVGEILKRLPGVTVGGRPGRGGGGVRMRGLGNGYTQMLVNGEKPPGGFSLESLSPDQVERIEIIRGPVAEHSTQAIAGTINIVLREGYQQKDIQLRLTDSIEQGRHSPNLSVTVPGKAGKLTWLMSASVFENRRHDESSTHNIDQALAGPVELEQQVHDQSDGISRGIHLSPRLSYKFDSGDTLTFQPFLVHNDNSSQSQSDMTQSVGKPERQAYARQLGDTSSTSTFLRGFGNWVHKMGGGAKLDVKFGFGGGKSDSDTLRSTFDAAGVPKKAYTDSDSTRDHGLNTGGKYTTPIGKGHLLAAGWDIEANHRDQTHVALDNGDPLFDDSGASLTADTRRMAAFVQDEWDITPQWSAYLGLRWEGIRTTSTSSGADVSNTSRVWSPVLHTVYRIPGHAKDQVRAALTQSYRAPALNDLIATPTFSSDNRETRPDRIGNPNLKPELAKGLDLAYEHYLGKSGIVSASAFVRDIDNLMRRETTKQMTSRGLKYVSSPINIDHARTSGIELEAKFPLTEVMAGAPNIDLRSNYSRFWSNVDGIPGPNNRLDQQAKQTANFGLDWRLKSLPLTVGGGLNWTPPILVQTSKTELVSSGVKRQLDLYGLWKFNPRYQLRVAANNLFADDYDSGRTLTSEDVAHSAFVTAHTYATFSIKLEMKL
ncbi:TonB-dependent receptor [Massilia sp. R2A-15]|uniref:TonB-dependent receptor plug domain-containing protein n=1 Tax=Massilia sp. R2A-15 TaxID=3064278 RepID=UPI002733FF18|nr:TonB-dependent receptor [Massilia sp. R2A-15]WLI88941.1 TonB-dependent receptor [Massilia sp. R2A-15]